MNDVTIKKLFLVCVVIVVFLSVSVVVLWNKFNSKSVELDSLKSNTNIQKVLSDTKAKLDEVHKRQEEIYPQLIEANKKLKDQSDKLSKIQADIKLVKKEKINEEVSKMDLGDMSLYLLSVGYPNSIVSK
jgi:septal ring factor EnvC (AmiA/AmiB activator)